MLLGAFSVSLNVKNINNSKDFYEKLGFVEFAGNIEQNWLIMKNGEHLIGLFQGMFDKNMLAFNPGWDQDAQSISDFHSYEELADEFKLQGLEVQKVGEASFIVTDPDGNPILIDQHV